MHATASTCPPSAWHLAVHLLMCSTLYAATYLSPALWTTFKIPWYLLTELPLSLHIGIQKANHKRVHETLPYSSREDDSSGHADWAAAPQQRQLLSDGARRAPRGCACPPAHRLLPAGQRPLWQPHRAGASAALLRNQGAILWGVWIRSRRCKPRYHAGGFFRVASIYS